jgi:hypothetical protein
MTWFYRLLGWLGFEYCPKCGTKLVGKPHGYYDDIRYYCPKGCN